MTYNNGFGHPSFNGNFEKASKPTSRRKQTLLPHPDFPSVRNLEDAVLALGRRHWEFKFKKYGYTPQAYLELLFDYGFEFRSNKPIEYASVNSTLSNLTMAKNGRMMERLKYKWGRNGKDPVYQYAPRGPIAEALNSDDDFMFEVLRSHKSFSAWRLMSLWHQTRARR